MRTFGVASEFLQRQSNRFTVTFDRDEHPYCAMTATLDNKLLLNAPSIHYLGLSPSNLPPARKITGTWDAVIEGSRYRLSLSEGGRKETVDAVIQSDTLSFQTSDGSAFAFEKEP